MDFEDWRDEKINSGVSDWFETKVQLKYWSDYNFDLNAVYEHFSLLERSNQHEEQYCQINPNV